MREQPDARKQPQQGWGCPHDRQSRPLALCFHAQMRAGLLECHLQLPAQHIPLHDLLRQQRLISAEQRLRLELPRGSRISTHPIGITSLPL
jgi:hypothetical protein